MKRVSLEQARKLKELGCDLLSYHFYDRNGILYYGEGNKEYFNNVERFIFEDDNVVFNLVSAPYIAEALEWIRNEKGIMGIIDIHWNIVNLIYYWKIKYIYEKTRDIIKNKIIHDNYHTYEEAESALLDELLVILEESK